MITHLLDSSAILAHYFHEHGAETVNDLLTNEQVAIGITTVSLTELKGQILRELPTRSREDVLAAEQAFRLYADELLATLPVTKKVSDRAADILWNSGGRLNPTEAIVVATALLESAILVHANPAYSGFSDAGVKELKL